MKIALLPGGFKPPHLGHYNMAKYLADFADNVIVRIGQKEREGIGKELALEVWNFYKEFDPDPRAKKLTISVAQSPSPVKDVYDFVEKIAPEGSTVILGLGEKDASDGRYNSIPKFAEPRNIKAEIKLVPPQAGGISGTRMREIIKANDKDTFFKYIPEFLPEEIKEEIWTKLVDTTMPVQEFMGGTMNKQEMAKHMANMKKLRKFFSKQGDQMTQIPTKLTKGLRRKLYEGRYDEEVLKQSRFVINKFKEEFGKEFKGESDKSYIGWLKGTPTQKKKPKEFQLTYKLDLEFIPDKDLESIPFDIYANAGPNSIYIKIAYNPDSFPEAYNELIYEIKDTIRHELEHVGQYEFDKDAYPEGEDLEGFDYFTAEEEIPAFVQGLYKQAKTRKLPLSQVFDEFLASRSSEITDKEEELIKLIWTDYARQNLPAAQLDEGDPKVGTGKKPKGSGRRLYTDEDPTDTVSVKFSTRQDIIDTLSKKSFKSKSHARQSQIINLIHQRVRAAYNRAKDPDVKKRLKTALDYAEKRKEASKKKTQQLKKENFPPYKANQVQQVRYKASDVFTRDIEKAKKLGYDEDMKESKLFSKEWWSDVIMEELLNEGGAAGHMAHPFDLPNVNTGKDLIKSFEQAADSLKKQPGSVKIDGVNASIRLVNFDGKREFAMDRGSKKALDLKGVTKADLEDRFGPGHGMIKAGGDVLDIFNDAMNTIQPELEALGMWDDPNIMFNMEYVSGKSNVQDYGKNFLAIHGLLNVETKEVQGARQMLVKRVTSEKGFNQSDMDSLLKKLEPFAKKKGFEIYGSVPTRFTKDPDFKSVLNKRYTIDTAEGDQTKTLAQWLDDVTNIPKTDRLKMNIEETDSIKDVGALSKQVYFAVFGGENVDSLFSDEQEVNKAIQGATTYLATEKLGDAILDVLDSPMGSVNDHEGVVIRDEKISPRPFKITGKFITGGVSSQFQTK